MSQNYGPEQRRLLETVATRVYANAVAHGYTSEDDPRFDVGSEDRAALDLLVDIGLLTLDDHSGRYVPADPTAIQSRVVVPLGQQGAELLTESARWADAFSALGQTYRKSPHVIGRPITEIRGAANINAFIQTVLADCRSEMLTAQPRGRRPEKVLNEAVKRDLDVLRRGSSIRTLYQHAARNSPATRDYVTQVSASGAEVRTLDEFFNRLIVIDARLAIIPGDDKDESALAIHEKPLVSYLVDIFERSWERALPFTNKQMQTHKEIAEDIRNMTIRMLVEGHSDPASAKRLGVSTRTYAGYIASLKEEYGVQTRFQLGHAMGRLSPPEEPNGDDPTDR